MQFRGRKTKIYELAWKWVKKLIFLVGRKMYHTSNWRKWTRIINIHLWHRPYAHVRFQHSMIWMFTWSKHNSIFQLLFTVTWNYGCKTAQLGSNIHYCKYWCPSLIGHFKTQFGLTQSSWVFVIIKNVEKRASVPKIDKKGALIYILLLIFTNFGVGNSMLAWFFVL